MKPRRLLTDTQNISDCLRRETGYHPNTHRVICGNWCPY